MSQGQDVTVDFDVKFANSSDSKDDVSTVSALHGLICHNDAHPSDLTLELVTGITQLRPGATIVLKLTSPKPILKGLVLSKLSISVANAIKCDKSSVKFQKKVCSPSEMMMRIKAPEEGQFEVSTKLYDHHVLNSPVILPVMEDPEKHLAEIGIIMSEKSVNYSPAEVLKEEARQSAISVKVDKSTQFEEITLETDHGQDNEFNKGPNAENEVELPETSLLDDMEDVDETELGACVEVETDPVSIDLTDGDTYMDDQDLKEIADIQGATAIFNEINGLNQSRDLNKSAENFDFALQQKVMILEEDNVWKKGIIENYIKTDNIYIVKTEAGYAGVAPGFIKNRDAAADVWAENMRNTWSEQQLMSETKDVDVVYGAAAVSKYNEEIPDLVGDIPDLVSVIPDLVDTDVVDDGPRMTDPGLRLHWTPGDFCFAKWSEDNIWYNAKVLFYFDAEKKYSVQFTDYGNEDLVGTNSMVKKCTDIPPGELIDDNVLNAFEVKLPQTDWTKPGPEEAKPTSSPDHLSPLRRPSFVSRESVSDPLLEVRVDDSLQSTPKPATLLKLPELSTVPPSLQCILCKKLAKRAMVLRCSNDLVLCWNCGVMKINVGAKRVCWVCNEENIGTNHMARKEELREAIETFTKTGSLPVPNHEKMPVDQLTQPQENTSQSLDILPLLCPGPEDVPTLHVSEVLKIDVSDPSGVAKLRDGSILILDNRGSDGVVKYDDLGNFIEYVRPSTYYPSDLHNPSDVFVCRNGDIVITDRKGLHLFDTSLRFKKTMASEFAGECKGLTEDDEGNILTLHLKPSKTFVNGRSKITTSILFIDRESGARKKIFDLEDLISAAIEDLGSGQHGPDRELLVSECFSIKFKLGKIYITGMKSLCGSLEFLIMSI